MFRAQGIKASSTSAITLVELAIPRSARAYIDSWTRTLRTMPPNKDNLSATSRAQKVRSTLAKEQSLHSAANARHQ